jgi:predicted nucleotidyltransferase
VPDKKPDFSGIVKALHDSGVRYVLIGGLAMVAHGSSHVTVDIDLSYARDPENLSALSELLRANHSSLREAPPDLPFILDERTLKSMSTLTLQTDFGDVDLLAEPPGVVSFDHLWNRSQIITLFGIDVHVASLDDLIAMKEAANRPKDRNHLLELRALKQAIEE